VKKEENEKEKSGVINRKCQVALGADEINLDSEQFGTNMKEIVPN